MLPAVITRGATAAVQVNVAARWAGLGPPVTSAIDTLAACTEHATNPGSAYVSLDGEACCVTKVCLYFLTIFDIYLCYFRNFILLTYLSRSMSSRSEKFVWFF